MTQLPEIPHLKPAPEDFEPGPGQGRMNILDRTGDSKFMWNTSNQTEVDAAREMFNTMKKKGYFAYTVGEDSGKGERITEFDPSLGKIIMTPPVTGG